MAGSVQWAVCGHCGITITNGQRSGWLRTASANADLRLPHSFGAALAAAMQKKNDGPLLAVVAPPIFRQVDLEAVGDSMRLNLAVQESRILRRLRLERMLVGHGAAHGLGHATQASTRQAAHPDFSPEHRAFHHNDFLQETDSFLLPLRRLRRN